MICVGSLKIYKKYDNARKENYYSMRQVAKKWRFKASSSLEMNPSRRVRELQNKAQDLKVVSVIN